MEKQELLAYLEQIQQGDALEVAAHFGVSYATAAMALLRLTRQDLTARYLDGESELYCYELTPKGIDRLDFLSETDLPYEMEN